MKTRMPQLLKITLSLICLNFLVSCAAVGVGTLVGGGILVKEDRRMPGQILDDQKLEYQLVSSIKQQLGDQARVEVVVFNDVVLLTGEVVSNRLVEDILQLVKTYAQSDVQVVNEVFVAQPGGIKTYAKDSLLTAKIKSIIYTSSLKANQNRKVGDETDYSLTNIHAKVVSHQGVVYLLGILTDSERSFLENTIRRVKGVKKVVTITQDWNEALAKQREKIGNIQNRQSPNEGPELNADINGNIDGNVRFN